MPIIRKTPLKQNIRLWFDYLKVALNTKEISIRKLSKTPIKVVVNRDYYRAWHLPQVREISFDAWWKTHKHLFAHKEYLRPRVSNELSLNDAMKEVKRQLIGKVDKKSSFQITSKRFKYKEVDDYLKCWKLRQTKVFNRQKKEYLPMQYNDIAIKIAKSYRKKTKSKKVVRRTFGVGIAESYFDRKVLHSVKKRVNNAKMIILNTAKGQFTGKY
jgi:hypothetical protein|tara:strand:- start:12 stop:653 length:642 start_codon:yes stop_codon:yes gene_type:complete